MSSVIGWADLRARLAAANLAYGGFPVPACFPNTTFQAPPGNRPWLRVDLSSGSGVPAELGGGTWADDGAALVDIIVRVGTGVDATAVLQDDLKAMFRGPPYEPLTYTRIVADPGGQGDDDGEFFITSMRASWQLQTRIIPRS